MEQAIEARLLIVWTDYILQKQPAHLSKHYDGLRVDTERCQAEEAIILPGPLDGKLTGVKALCMHSTQYIKDQTGFEVRIRHKEHKTIIGLFDDFVSERGSGDWRKTIGKHLDEDFVIYFTTRCM